jgi:hypothetical protein
MTLDAWPLQSSTVSQFGLPGAASVGMSLTLPKECAWFERWFTANGPCLPPGGEALMQGLLRPILNDDALTRHLGDSEARILVEWLVERAECLEADVDADAKVRALCRRARAIGLFIGLWCYRGQQGAAAQLANAEQFKWPLPEPGMDPDLMMDYILEHESRSATAA